ncbi:hypothetical protein KH5H1_00380 [Corallococcus caeni]|uniref:hypothetical protein n=1 Tax=Corallococcus caeni TaxID=3082388 RepID=UPI002955FD4D|nr:hypothetical protein KH5H1_00380 [Corallococcus sp. KH5-1]
MRMQGWLGLAVTGWLVGCGVEPEDSATAAQVQAQVCAPGSAQEVKQVIPPDHVPGGWLNEEPRPRWLTDVAGTLFFAVDLERGTTLWKSDGTTAGTIALLTLPAPDTGERRIQNLTAVGTRLFFELYDPANGLTLWVSDGTATGTLQVKDLSACDDSSAQYGFQSHDGALTFLHEPCGAGHVELWRSDGTKAGTVRVQDFGSGTMISGDARTFSARVLFVHQDGVGPRLWRTDGTAAGTVEVRTFGPQSRVVRTLEVSGAVLFIVQDPTTGTTLWRTDGTAEGTRLLKRLDASSTVVLENQHVVGGTAVFAFYDAGPSTEVWKTDGTESGTVRLDTFGTEARLLGIAGPYAILVTRSADQQHQELRRLSLSGGGKELVAVLDNPFADESTGVGLQGVIRTGDRIFLSQVISSMEPTNEQVSLWVTDGTAAGTRELAGGLSTSKVAQPPLFDTGTGTVLFVNRVGWSGLEPWVTDGTLAGTQPIADIQEGPGSSHPLEFQRVGNRVFFNAMPTVRAFSLWSVPAALSCSAGNPAR